jgi:nondiscriminating glutamyl-tRNA synthetase
MPRYDGRCQALSSKEISEQEASGLQAVLRFRVGRGSITFEDLVHGKMSFASEGIGDFIIVRSDAMAAYNFACVIDDHFMHVTHVIRGEDHLSNTPRQILVYKTLEWESPVFAHHPLILGPDRSPLSKRHGATAVSHYREEGFLPEALLNYLVLLGWTSPSGKEVLPLDQMIEEFSIETLARSAPIHSRKKLEWLNSSYIRLKDGQELSEFLLPYLEKEGLRVDQIDRTTLTQIAEVTKENLVVLSQIKDYLGIFFDERFAFDEEARTVLLDTENRETLRTLFDAFGTLTEITADSWSSCLAAQSCLHSEHYDLSAAYFLKAFKMDPRHINLRFFLNFSLGMNAYLLNSYPKALSSFTKLVSSEEKAKWQRDYFRKAEEVCRKIFSEMEEENRLKMAKKAGWIADQLKKCYS